MANSASRPDRAYHQDYICRIRYENSLPPPPGSVKLLDIPIDGLDYYASPGFASRLHRSQPINIEADAELGMPIDLVGMPGVFDGDESSIQAPLIPPPVHSRDKNLLRPLSELGKPKYQPGGISFLRRTEYISSDAARARSEAAPKTTPKAAAAKLRKTVDTSKDDPVHVLRAAVKGFDLAHPEDAYTGTDTQDSIKGLEPTPAEIEAWNNPKHPTKSNLKAVDFYPILPDLEAGTDTGNYMIAKFTANPTQIINKHDPRMDVGLLRPIELDDATVAEYSARLAAHTADPVHNLHPGGPPFNYHFFLPTDENSAINLKRKLDVDDSDRDDLELYTAKNKDGKSIFRLSQQRVYETGRSTAPDADHAYNEIALALHDPDLEVLGVGGSSNRLEKAAYYYPVMQKVQLKPYRSKTLAQLGVASRTDDEGFDVIDVIDVVVENLDKVENAKRHRHRAELLGEAVEEDGAEDGDS
ncbi:MAG: hypothetical protein LQ348_000527 [Seirophora lacunosa]|nr:MAG: hypothetical protein LQ344_000917 [Seirophora lacunosa]KAI4207582.1 MAG: hypothetical protein LQ348_000527 [Seirophora lacunosa]